MSLANRSGRPDSGARVLSRLIGECLQFPGRIAVICVSLLALGGARLYVTWLVKLGEAPLFAGDMPTIVGLMTTGAGAAGVMILAMFASRYALASVNQGLVQQLRDAAQRRVLAMRIVAAREPCMASWLPARAGTSRVIMLEWGLT